MSWLASLRAWWIRMRTGSRFMCDTCKYNYGNACWRPERPNAVSCPDYRRR
ncbi:MAG: hypothetical protein FWJ73_00375 [Limnochordales bacterium]